ncbi:MAG: hypothetical protein ACI4VL_06985 [Bacilli bacterium]
MKSNYEPKNVIPQKYRNNPDRRRPLRANLDSIEQQKKVEEMAKKNFEHYGNNRTVVEEGTKNRLEALPYNLPEKYVLEKDKTSFYYGYYEKGTRTINAQIKILSPERLEAIGKNDALDDNIIFEQLPEEIKNNPFYLSGYNIGYNEKKTKGKGR